MMQKIPISYTYQWLYPLYFSGIIQHVQINQSHACAQKSIVLRVSSSVLFVMYLRDFVYLCELFLGRILCALAQYYILHSPLTVIMDTLRPVVLSFTGLHSQRPWSSSSVQLFPLFGVSLIVSTICYLSYNNRSDCECYCMATQFSWLE